MNLEVSFMQVPLKIIFRESRGGLQAENAGCSSRVPDFDSHTPCGYLQSSLTPIPGKLTPFLVSLGPRYAHGTQICMVGKHL